MFASTSCQAHNARKGCGPLWPAWQLHCRSLVHDAKEMLEPGEPLARPLPMPTPPTVALSGAGRASDPPVGKRAEWAAMFEAHHLRLYRLAVLWTGDPTLSEDIVADAFVRLHRPWSAGEVRDVGAYLRTSVVNAANGDLRRQRRAAALIERLEAPAARHDVDVPSGVALRGALAQLPLAQRAVVLLRYFEELTVEETAAVLRIRPGTVKSRTARALPHLRRLLEDGRD